MVTGRMTCFGSGTKYGVEPSMVLRELDHGSWWARECRSLSKIRLGLSSWTRTGFKRDGQSFGVDRVGGECSDHEYVDPT